MLSGGAMATRQAPKAQVALLISAIASATLLAVVAVAMYGSGTTTSSAQPDELLLKVHLEAHEPYSPPSNMYLWWGPSTNHRFVGSGEHIRHLLHLGQIEGGEWRDPMFLGNNGVSTFRSQRFRRISNTCCSTIVIPPMEWDFPVYNIHKIIGQRIRNFVANGNMLVLTGGIMAVEFINSYFFYNIEDADGNYSPGPYRRLDDPNVPKEFEAAPTILPQKGISVTAVKKESLPSGTQVVYGTPRSSPVFMIKFCEAENAMEGMPPAKVLPRDCPLSEKEGRPCSCGWLMYIGYNYQEQYPTRWDKVLRAAVEILNPTTEGGPAEEKGEEESLAASHIAGREDSEEGHVEGREAKLEKAEQKESMQQEEINELKAKVEQLARGSSSVRDVSPQDGVMSVVTKARTQQLSLSNAAGGAQQGKINALRQEAVKILAEYRAAKAGRAVGATQQLSSTDGHREHADKNEKLLMSSVLQLAKDMKQVDSKVDKLSDSVKAEEQHGGRRDHAARGRDRRDERRGDGGERAEVRKYRREARAAKKELKYEQSVAVPQYTYAEEDHTTPLFGSDGRARSEGCGTLCRLKKLVKKTRASISKELTAALD